MQCEFEKSDSLDVNQSDFIGDTPIHIALKTNQMSLAKRLATHPNIDLNVRDSEGDPVLVLAMKLNEESFAVSIVSKPDLNASLITMKKKIVNKPSQDSEGTAKENSGIRKSSSMAVSLDNRKNSTFELLDIRKTTDSLNSDTRRSANLENNNPKLSTLDFMASEFRRSSNTPTTKGDRTSDSTIESLSSITSSISSKRTPPMSHLIRRKTTEEMDNNSIPPPIPLPPIDYPIHLAIKYHLASLSLKLIDKLSLEELCQLDPLGRTCLHLAIYHSLLGVAHAIVQKFAKSTNNANHNIFDFQDFKTGDTALHLALRTGRCDLARQLAEKSNLKLQNYLGETCLHVCTRLVIRSYHSTSLVYASSKLFKRLLDLSTYDLVNLVTFGFEQVPKKMKEFYNKNPRLQCYSILHQACAVDHPESAGLWLLESLFKSPHLNLEILDGFKRTPLALAMESNNMEISKLLISNPMVNINRLVGMKKQSYFHYAVKMRLPQIIQALSFVNAYPGYWDIDGYTPLHLACFGQTEIPNGSTSVSVVKNWQEVFPTQEVGLFRSYPSSNESPPITHSKSILLTKPPMSPLVSHKSLDHVSTLNMLLKNQDLLKYHLNDRTEFSGLTPLMIALKYSKDINLITVLLESGCDFRLLEPKTRFGPFQICLELELDEQICKYLIDFVSDPNTLVEEEKYCRVKLIEKLHYHSKPRKFSEEATSQDDDDEQNKQEESSEDEDKEDEIEPCMEADNENNDEDIILVEKRTEESFSLSPKNSLQQEGFKRSQKDLTVDEEDQSRSQSENTDFPKKKPREEELFKKLTNAEKLQAVHTFELETIEIAREWVESENGKAMIFQSASVLMHHSDIAITFEAALEIAKRNYFAEYVQERIQDFREKLFPNISEEQPTPSQAKLEEAAEQPDSSAEFL